MEHLQSRLALDMQAIFDDVGQYSQNSKTLHKWVVLSFLSLFDQSAKKLEGAKRHLVHHRQVS